ncbi:MAG: hydrogenase/urease maturation nickel metallochaperone HypA [Candidatus Nanohaloarchaea archaeon]
MEKVGNVLIDLMQDLSRYSTDGDAHIKINSSMCEPRQFQTLFDYFTKGTILERIDLKVEELNTYVNCSCGYKQDFQEDGHAGYTRCPRCGKFAEVKDRPYELVKPNPGNADLRTNIRFS